MTREILVLGAGMIGTCTALELSLRGHAVTLVDRRPPGQETSFGNAGVIQREAVKPYAFPRDARSLLSAALGRGLEVHYHPRALLAALPQLWRYWRHSAPARHQAIARDYAALIAHATTEHARYIALAGADDLVRRDGLRLVFRTPRALDEAVRDAERVQREHGVRFVAMDADALAAAEPDFRTRLAGAVHWLPSWSVDDPGGLVERYAQAFLQRGGRFVQADATAARPSAHGWALETDQGRLEGAQAVVALGPWSDRFVRALGYRLPLFVKRGYHRHYRGGGRVTMPTLDAERGYVLAPQRRGLRLTTGAEIAGIDAPLTPRQLTGAEAQARGLLELGEAVESEPWVGSRPCSADMKPVIGPAPRHPGLWFNFAHGHQGFTLGPASARLLADLMTGEPPFIDAAPFLARRFGG
ncbi:FAD-dependent oxidoreductase [Roseateles sp.]|uniref:NAD(P)/FAD-dependent oxidoreductase n=1 Tax=Roseateles sp. TaxID=1971397 RepID=UPI0031E10579